MRHVARMFVTGASLTVPLFGIVLRKGYGLGAQAMIGGGFHASFFTVAWPTGEFGGMGLEGYVRLGFRKEMEAIADPVERENYYKAKVAELYANGKAVSIASRARDRRGDRSRRDAALDHVGPALGAEAGSAHAAASGRASMRGDQQIPRQHGLQLRALDHRQHHDLVHAARCAPASRRRSRRP